MAINDNGLQYRHPHVSSVITNNDVIITSTSSNDSFFYTIVSEKGEDNVTKVMSSSEEYIKEYGEPNLAKYGQAGYNIINLLDGGAEVYVLRVLPDDASFAHAFLNIQTKVKAGFKTIKDINGKEVKMDDVSLRVCTAYSEGRIHDVEGLEGELKNERRNSESIDGYTDHLLLCMYPKGRGRYYNNLSFRLNLNSSYDEIYDFRVYSLEIVKYDEYNNANIIEGPYQVALDPDAMNANGESMFIVDVLDTYSDVMNCIFNEDVYDDIAAMINPDVAPGKLDIITGQSREIMGEVETYLEPTTKRNLDTHIRLHKYNTIGEPIMDNGYQVLNVANDDSNTLSLIAIDNQLRRENYEFYYNISQEMKIAIGKVLNKSFLTEIELMFSYLPNGNINTESGLFQHTKKLSDFDKEILALIYEDGEQFDYVNPEPTFPHRLAPDSILTLKSGNKPIDEKELLVDLEIKDCIGRIERILAYLKLVPDAATICNTLELNVKLWNKIRKQKSSIDTQINDILFDSVSDVIPKLMEAAKPETNDPATRLSKLIEVYSILDDKYIPILETLVAGLDPRYSQYADDKQIPNLDGTFTTVTTVIKPFQAKMQELLYDDESDYKYCKNMLSVLASIYLPDDELSSNISALIDKIDPLQNAIIELITLAYPLYRYSEDLKILYGYPQTSTDVMPLSAYLLGKNGEDSSKVSTLLQVAYKITKDSYTDNVLSAGDLAQSKQDFISEANKMIKSTLATVNSEKTVKLSNELVLSDGISNLGNGSDGNIDEQNSTVNKVQRSINIENLLIKGYEGLIDSSILNNKLMRFKYLLDANYSDNVKRAMVRLVKDIRQDLFIWLDSKFCYSPEDAINWRIKFNINTNFAAIYAQNGIIHDEYQGKDIKVGTSYALSQKIPYCSTNYGLQYPIAGSRRGVVDCFKDNSISFYPNDLYKEQLYNRQVNYIETDGFVSKFGSQLTSSSQNTPLSNINNVLTILDVKRDVEAAAEDVLFEFNTDELASNFQQELNTSLASYVTSKACERIEANVYASDYDKTQKILRVNVEIKFNDIIERVIISLDVVK